MVEFLTTCQWVNLAAHKWMITQEQVSMAPEWVTIPEWLTMTPECLDVTNPEWVTMGPMYVTTPE